MGSNVWSVYIVQTARNSLYTGISPDVKARIATHNCGKGSRSLRGALPVELVYSCELGSRSLAQRAEHRLKKLSAANKRALVNSDPGAGQLIKQLGLESKAEEGAHLIVW